jgi:hypothetical protein
MPLTLWQISLLIDRKQDPICVGSFPRSVAEQLKLRIADVYLSRDSLVHIFEEHADLTKYDLLHVPFLPQRGLIVQETAKPKFVIASYKDPDSHRRFVGVVKILFSGAESYLVSFRRAKRGQAKLFLKRGNILKTHD